MLKLFAKEPETHYTEVDGLEMFTISYDVAHAISIQVMTTQFLDEGWELGYQGQDCQGRYGWMEAIFTRGGM